MLAAPAGFSADLAGAAHRGMSSACIGAGLAHGAARPKHRTGDLSVLSRIPGEDLSRSHADIDTVKVDADAFGQVVDHLSTEAGVGARTARLGALKARLDAFGEFRLIDASQAFRVGVRHPLYVCHWFLFPGLFGRSV